jgi:hypothetical protein
MLQTKILGKVTLLVKIFVRLVRDPNFAPGEVAEWSIAAVLKTVEGYTSGGSNPSLSANKMNVPGFAGAFLFGADGRACSIRMRRTKMEVSVANEHSFY